MTRHRDSLPFLVALDRGLSWGEIGCTAREQSVSGTGEPRERRLHARLWPDSTDSQNRRTAGSVFSVANLHWQEIRFVFLLFQRGDGGRTAGRPRSTVAPRCTSACAT